jgi:hypothetical protein
MERHFTHETKNFSAGRAESFETQPSSRSCREARGSFFGRDDALLRTLVVEVQVGYHRKLLRPDYPNVKDWKEG